MQVCVGGLGVGRTVPGEYPGGGGHVGIMSVVWSGYIGGAKAMNSKNVCNFEIELWGAKQAICDQMHPGVLGSFRAWERCELGSGKPGRGLQ